MVCGLSRGLDGWYVRLPKTSFWVDLVFARLVLQQAHLFLKKYILIDEFSLRFVCIPLMTAARKICLSSELDSTTGHASVRQVFPLFKRHKLY